MPQCRTGQRQINFLVQGVKATEQNDSWHNSRRTSGTVSGTSPSRGTPPFAQLAAPEPAPCYDTGVMYRYHPAPRRT